MASGVGVSSECLDVYQQLKLGHKHKYIIFSLNLGLTEIVTDTKSSVDDYEEFIANLPERECRYAVYDFEYDTPDGKRSKIVFIAWSPDEAKIKQKMVYASSKEALRRSLVGIATEIQATSIDEVSRESVLAKVARTN